MLPAILAVVPSLVVLAEKLIGGKSESKPDAGAVKKEFVMGIIEKFWDQYLGQKVFDLPGIDEKKIFLGLCSIVIDQIVLKLRDK